MKNSRFRSRRGAAERGSAILEMALGMTVLLLLLIGSIDFGPMMFTAIELQAASEAGAMYGVYQGVGSIDLAAMQTAALANAKDIHGVTAVASNYCLCAGETTPVGCATICSNSRAPGNYVSVATQATYTTIFKYGTVANPLPMTRTTIMRVN